VHTYSKHTFLAALRQVHACCFNLILHEITFAVCNYIQLEMHWHSTWSVVVSLTCHADAISEILTLRGELIASQPLV